MKPITIDNRDKGSHHTHTVLIGGKDNFLSNWGTGKEHGGSWAYWACRPEDADAVESWVSSRNDFDKVKRLSGKYPQKRGHTTVYVIYDGHVSLLP
jgi:hypothetical protein